MAKLRSLAVSALNIRIHPQHSREAYESLLRALISLKRAVRVRGDQHYMITHVTKDKDIMFGEIASFTNIDPHEPWFDQATGAEATDKDVEQISIPEHLKPNYRSSSFLFMPEKHILVFESGGTTGGLGKGLIKKLFENLCASKFIKERFGEISLDIAQDFDQLERMLKLPQIRKLTISLQKPNPDDFGGLDEQVEQLLLENNAKKYVEHYEAETSDTITPNDRTVSLAKISTQNGKTEINGRDENGATRKFSSDNHPAEHSIKYDPDQTLQRSALLRAAIYLIEKLTRL